MRLITNGFLTTSLAVFTALAVGPARAADVAASSAVDAVTVYPDGASVTRVISLICRPVRIPPFSRIFR
jgi:hypothetical protein